MSEMLDVFDDVNRGIYRRSAGTEDAPAGRDQRVLVHHGQRVCGRLEMRGRTLGLMAAAAPPFYQAPG